MEASFTLINDLNRVLAPLVVRWFVSGGWAIDIHLKRITRERCDLDISVPWSDHLQCIEFFLEKDRQVEGKLRGGFKSLRKTSDYEENIHYFWSFPKGADFVSEYVDQNGSRRIAYNRKTQHKLDYIEVFFDRIEEGYFIFSRDADVKRDEAKAILQVDGLRYLAPEMVLLYKSKRLSEKNVLDFRAVIHSLDDDSVICLRQALLHIYNHTHEWLDQLEGDAAR